MILKALKYIFTIGLKGINEPIQKSRIVLTNKIMLFGLISTMIYAMFDYIQGYYYCTTFLITLDFTFILSFYLRYKKKNSISIFLALSATSLTMFAISYFMKADTGATLVLIALTGLPALTYSLSKIKLMLTNMVLNSSLILFSIYFNFKSIGIYTIPKEQLAPLYFSLMAVTLLLIALQFYIFVNEIIKGQMLYTDGMNKLNKNNRTSDLGIMSAGIAHEINNPLMIIKMHNERLAKLINQIQFDHLKANRSLSIINQNCERISAITSGLRFISKDESLEEPVTVEIGESILSVLSLIKEKIKSKNIELIHNEDTQKCYVKAKKGELHQVFIGLISNSVDALENTLNPYIKIDIIINNNRVYINLIDNGPGVKSNLEDDIMKPFFTTKDEGKGMGLGLSIAKSILASHNGDLSYARNNAQTYFTISLPYIQYESSQNLKKAA